jgi:hypothetical protein
MKIKIVTETLIDTEEITAGENLEELIGTELDVSQKEDVLALIVEHLLTTDIALKIVH